MIRRTALFLLSVGLLIGASIGTPAAAASSDGFSDMDGHWAEVPVALLVARGTIAGFPDGLFRPGLGLTRAQAAKLLVTVSGHGGDASALQGSPMSFRDVPGNHWAKGYVEAARELRLIRGYADGTFRPEQAVSRVEFAVLLSRLLPDSAAAPRPLGFTDAGEIPAWAADALRRSVSAGLIGGYPDGGFRPDRPVSRAEAVVSLARLLEGAGRLFDRYGVVVPPEVTGTLHIETLSGVLTLPLAPASTLFRNESRVKPSALRPLDEVGVVLDEGGRVSAVRATYIDRVGRLVSLARGVLTIAPNGGGAPFDVGLAEDARLFLNGAPTEISQLTPGLRVYAVLSDRTGLARFVDAVRADRAGVVVGSGGDSLDVRAGGATVRLRMADGAIVMLAGALSPLASLRAGDHVLVALDEEGRAVYIEADR